MVMKNQWIIRCVGASEDDEAHLRLLLRSARKQVGEDWAWGSGSEADLLLMGRHSPIDDAAIRRAAVPGVASALLIDADEPTPAGLFLRKPFNKDAFAALLAKAVAKGDTADPANGSVASVAAQAGSIGSATQGLPQTDNDSLPAPSKVATPNVDQNATRWLLQYLPQRIFGGPAQIALADAPLLVIDPEARMFFANGPLPALEPYSREALRFGDWKRLTGAELEEARKGMDARPYAQLIWMDSFIHSKGSLSRRFDPEGSYRLTKRLDLANDYPRALRISAQMERSRKLADIARASGAELAEVFDVVNAYEAIGYLEWTRQGAAPSH